MINVVAVGATGGEIFATSGGIDLLRGAVLGAFFVSAAYLTGLTLMRRSSVALAALLLVIAGGALQLGQLGYLGGETANMAVLFKGLFAAAVLLFLSASIGAARRSAIMGAVLFTFALVFAGMGVINFVDRVDLAPLLRFGLYGVGGVAILLAVWQAVKGDAGAQMVLPGAVLVVAGSLISPFFGAESAIAAGAAHAFFSVGVLAASLAAFIDGPGRMGAYGDPDAVRQDFSNGGAAERDEIVIDSQIARVLDYAGIATWDWSDGAVEQTSSLPQILGADSTAPFTPEAMRRFVHETDVARFENEVAMAKDGAFDVVLKLFDGRIVRLRGARAIDPSTNELERVVAFVEGVDDEASPGAGAKAGDVRKATAAAVVPTAAMMAAGAKLSDALDKGDIVAAFQPIVSLNSEKVAGYEALARWRGQEEGVDEGPESFVKTAEAAGKGEALAQTMLSAAGAFLAEKIKTEKAKRLFVTLNVSFGQMRAPGFVDAVRGAIDEYKLPDNALVLELTEADAVSDSAAAGKIFRSLKSAGAALAFDDFGAGFSCLSNLHKFDFDYIKIDKSFVDDLEKGNDKSKIVSALATLGKDLGMHVIAEGVETKATANAVRDIGCVYGQGFLYGRPLHAADAGDAAPRHAAPAGARDGAEEGEPSSPVLESIDAADGGAEAHGDKTDLAARDAETVDTELVAKGDAEERKESRWRPWRSGLR
ncbi:MAG: EAL domain-containing protein [Pseudomonadota bacterium]